MKKRVKLVRQHEPKDCGAACLAMILECYGNKIPYASICEAIKVDRQGANLYGLHDGAARFGLNAEILEGEAQDFIREVRSGQIKLPAIVRIVNRFAMEHYIVVTGVSGKKVRCCDPGEGRCSLSLEQFSDCFLGHAVTFEKTADFKEENRRKGSVMEFVSLITRQKGLVFTIGLLSILVTGISMAGTFLFQYLIDSVIPEIHVGMGHNHDGLCGIEVFAVLIAAVGLLYLVRFAVQLLRGKLLMKMSRQINLPLMLGYYDNVIDLKMDFFDNHQTGDLLTRFNDANKVQEALANVTLTLMIDVPMVLICGITLFRQSPELFGVIAAILVLYVIISAVYIRPLDKRNRQLTLENAQLNSFLKESFDNIQTVKAFNAGTSVKAKTRELFNNIQTYGIKTAMLSMSKDSLIEMIASFGTLALLWMGSVMIASGTLTLGSLMAFYTMLGYFLSPIQNVMELQNTLQAAVVAAGRLRDILDRTKESEDSAEEKAPFRNGDITVENVSFRYGNRFLVLDGLNVSIRQGESTAIVGPSGCGKTTVTKLILGFYTPEQGAVHIGGQDVGTMDLEDLRRNVAYVPQDVTMFSDSIRKNLLIGNDCTISDAEIEAALDAAGCDFVKEMPFGLDTMLEENASNVSGGQRQRLAIARALLRKPGILVLDEATSALDTISERKLQEALKKFDPNMTVIMVAHRLNSIRNCDHILVLDKGNLAEEGTHAQLMERNGLYAAMYNSMN